jgi:UDP-N-acetylglucosamine 2-epimerase (non-hydrolysing)
LKTNKIVNIDIVAGARPNFIKIAPLMHELQEHKEFRTRLIHTGQHYDKKMSDDFFRQLEIPEPDINLSVGSGSQAFQTAGIMQGYEHFLNDTYKPDLCIVVGDVTSTMACAIVAKKEQIKVAHIEAGLRSGDHSMPEEINRILTDSITDYFFTTSLSANNNLKINGIESDRIFFVGNIMIDTLRKFETKLYPPDLWEREKLKKGEYFLLTLHRPSNVDDDKTFLDMINYISDGLKAFKIIYPVHPRVSEKLSKSNQKSENMITTIPLPYLEFNYLVKHAKAVITDSGGITEETTVFGVPCLTLRKNTERPETVEIGTNKLIIDFPSGFDEAIAEINSNFWKKGCIPEKWDGKTARRIVECLFKIYR